MQRDDFMEDAPRKFFRLKPGGEVRLRYAYIIQCNEVIKDADGNVTELLCTYDADTRSGSANSDRKVKGTIHWVSADTAIDAEVRLYDRLFTDPQPGRVDAWRETINPDSLVVAPAKLEASMMAAEPGKAYQFERVGYFTPDVDGTAQAPVYNRIVSLRDSWAKAEKQALAAINKD